MMNLSINSQDLSRLSPKQRIELGQLLEEYQYRWSLNAREKQKLPQGNWQTWMISAGRGFGKTRTGAETVREWKENSPIIHLVGATAGDVRDIMVEGESGILSISPKWDKPKYEPSKRRLTWDNGARALLFSADEPDRLRGPQCYKAWADELAAWRYPDAWDQLQFGLRLGNNPQCVVTTTPRPTKIIKELIKDKTTVLTTGSSYENKANLADAFFDKIIKKYEGTTLGRQELYAEILEDIDGALWKMATIEKWRVFKQPEFKKIYVSIDPSGTSTQSSDEAGIIGCGLGSDDRGYIIEDDSRIMAPNDWAKSGILMYNSLQANAIVAEVNQGWDMVKTIIHNLNPNIPVIPVTARKGKWLRAEPVQMLYQQGRVSHIGNFPKLEEEMTTWTDDSDWSPNRMDAMVHGITSLMLDEEVNYNYS